MCVGLVPKALLSQRCKTDQNRQEARDWEKHALGHHAEIGLWKPLIVGGCEAEPRAHDTRLNTTWIHPLTVSSSHL